jgi:hypothetical protein
MYCYYYYNIVLIYYSHATGTIAGSAMSPDPTQTQFASAFNGMVPAARLAVDDLSADGESLSLPSDLNVGLFEVPYQLVIMILIIILISCETYA